MHNNLLKMGNIRSPIAILKFNFFHLSSQNVINTDRSEMDYINIPQKMVQVDGK